MSFGLTWRDWVGYTIEDASSSPYSETFASAPTTPTHFLPLAGAESVNFSPNILFSPTVQGIRAPTKAATGAQIVSGTIPTVVPLGVFGSTTPGDGRLMDWGVTRATYYTDPEQLPSATIWISVAGGYTSGNMIKKVTGAKIARMSFESASGGNWVNLSLDIVGRDMTYVDYNPTVQAIQTDIYGSDAIVPEYNHLESFFNVGSTAWNGTDYKKDTLTWSFLLDNKIIEDGFRLDGTGKLTRLYNTGRDITGGWSGDLRASTNAGYLVNGTEVDIAHNLTRSTSYLRFNFPRARIETGGPNSTGNRDDYNKESYTWRALGATSSPYSDMTVTENN